MSCIRSFALARLTITLLFLVASRPSLVAQPGDGPAGFAPEPFREEAAESSTAKGTDAATTRALLAGCFPQEPARLSPVAAREAFDDLLPVGTILRVKLGKALDPSRLRPGSTIVGTLLRPLYLRDLEAVSPGSRVHLVIDKVERAGRRRSTLGMLLANIGRFYWSQRMPDREYTISFRTATLTASNGSAIPLTLSFLRTLEPSKVQPDAPKTSSGKGHTTGGPQERLPIGTKLTTRKENGHSALVLEVEQPVHLPSPSDRAPAAGAGDPSRAPHTVILEPGTRAHLLLLNSISTSKNRAGDTLQARLEEPIRLNDQVVLPNGLLFEGRVTRLVPPRRLNRSGSLRLNFDRMTFRETPTEVATSVTAAELDPGSAAKIDPEGTLQAGRSAKRLALRFGAGGLTGKGADDLADTLTRYIGIGTALVYFLAHRGDDVIISKYSELEVTFDRAVAIPLLPQMR